MNPHDQHEREMTNLFRSASFMVSLTNVMFALTEGVFPAHKYYSAFSRLTSVLMEMRHPAVITDTHILLHQELGHFMGQQDRFHYLYITMRSCVIASQESHHKGYVEVEKTGHHCLLSCLRNGCLKHPCSVGFSYPHEVVV